jgi:hypothetical protein
MFFNLASVDESEDGYLGGSNTHLPRESTNHILRSTLGVDEDDGSSRMSMKSIGRKSRSLKNKYRRDNQTYCGTPGQKCTIF